MKALTLARVTVVVAVVMVATGLLWLRPSAAASNFSYNSQIVYTVTSDTTTAVTQTYNVTNNVAGQYLSGLELATPATAVSDLHASYASGQAIPVTTTTKTANDGDIRYSYVAINLRFPQPVLGQGHQWSFTISYNAQGLVETRGGGHTVYIPAIQTAGPDDTFTLKVDVPTSFGPPHFPGVTTTSSGQTGGREFFGFTKAQLGGKALALAFGDASIYNVNFNFPLHNDSALPRTETVTLPPDLDNQRVTLAAIDPKPAGTRLDADGNVLADYHLAPHQQLTVTTKALVDVRYLEYRLADTKTKRDIPAALVRRYTGATPYWQTSGTVAAAARSVTKPNAPVIDNVRALYQLVIDKLTYNPAKIEFNVRQGATAALANPTNVVCLEYADLLVALLRSQGIPAREPIGYAYSGGLKSSPAVADSLHAWVEAYVPGIGWMTLDPTWGEKFDQFGQSDLDHVAFAVWGASDQTPAPVMIGATDLGYQYADTTIGYVPSLPAPVALGTITATRYVVLPFVIFDHIIATARPDVASDGNAVRYDGATVDLGSLAPAQRASVNRLSWRRDWLGGGQAQLVGAGGAVLATAAVGRNFVPLATIVVILCLYLITRGVIRLRARSRHDRGASEVHHAEV